MRTWSAQQDAIFAWFARQNAAATKNLVVRARAGTGKTTTVIEGVSRAPECREALLCAFNKRIATELQARLPKGGAEAKTLHAIGFGFVMRNWDRPKVDDKRGYRIAERVLGDQAPEDVISLVQRLTSLGKNAAPRASTDTLEDLALAHGHLPSERAEYDGWTLKRIAAAARDCMIEATKPEEDFPTIDFDDMIYLPVVNGWARPKWALVVVDEAQDMNPTQLELALKIASGRIAVVGDDRQAIYGFRGADSNAIDNLKRKLEADELGLTVTYRCGKAIVDHAKTLVPDFEAAATNGDGEIAALDGFDKLFVEARPGDFVLSRINAPLVPICLRLLREGKRARVEGRDIGSNLATIVKKRRASSIEDLENRIVEWREREVSKALAKGGRAADTRVQTVEDQAETILALCDGLATVDELLMRIDELFRDAAADGTTERSVVCSSVHKSKGLEADRVFVLKSTLYPGGRENIEEANLEYVAVTRAKRTLVWVPKQTRGDLE